MYLFQLRKSWKMKWALEERVEHDWSNLAAAEDQAAQVLRATLQGFGFVSLPGRPSPIRWVHMVPVSVWFWAAR